MTSKPTLTASDLDHFHGSETFYRHWYSRKHIYTEGIHFLAERAGAFWLVDKIALHGSPAIHREDFQTWKLTVNPDQTATLTTTDGNDTILKTEQLHYTDFPLPEITLWAERNELGGHTIMLPSER